MRLDIDSIREIADSLVRNKRRSILTGFGVFWGLFMLLFLIGGGNGLKQMLSQNFDGFANNTVILMSSNTSKPYKGLREGRYWDLTIEDVERLPMMIPELDIVTPMVSRWGTEISFQSRSTTGGIKGITPEYGQVETSHIQYGRYLNSVDMELERKVCIIGKRIYNDLFPEGGDPCGSYIRIGSVYMQIVGVDFSTGNLSINGPLTRSVLIPYTVAAKLYNSGHVVDLICVTGKPDVRMSSLEERIRNVVARQHQFDPTDQMAMMVFNTEQLFAIVDNLFKGLNFLIWLVGIGTLLAGCIGVSNIMMVTVRERTVEIGIRRAIGALPHEILSQILMESVSLTCVAGCAGIVFSVFLLSGLEAITKHQAVFQIGFSTAVTALLLLAVLGALAGLAPAVRAMNIKPVEAMRDE